MKFTSSKFRNTRLSEAKRESWYSELQVGSVPPHMNGIVSSANFLAFPAKCAGGGSVTVLPLDATGKVSQVQQLIDFGGAITALDFSKLKDTTLAAASEDNVVRVFEIPENGLTDNTVKPKVAFSDFPKAISQLSFHPHVEELLAASCQKSIFLLNIITKEKEELEFPDIVHSFCWSGDGQFLAVTTGDCMLRIYDPRNKTIKMEGKCHVNKKATFCVYHPLHNVIITTGFDQQRTREFFIYDANDISKPKEQFSMDSGSSGLMAVVDDDSDLFWISGKGDATIRTYILNEGKPTQQGEVYNSAHPHSGLCVVGKRGLDVMQCEVSRLLRLVRDSVTPIHCNVPRKSYREFADDLFPKTKGTEPGCTYKEWLEGCNKTAKLISVDPATRPAVKISKAKEIQDEIKKVESVAPTPVTKNKTAAELWGNQEKEVKVVQERELKKVNVVRSSKFRHINGVVRHRNNNVEGITQINIALPADSCALICSEVFVAYPIAGAGGQIGIIPWTRKDPKSTPSSPIRLTDKPFCIDNISSVLDFSFSPYDPNLLVTGLEDSNIRVWRIPSNLKEALPEPIVLKGHHQKVNIVKFHPLAKDVLISCGYDNLINVWDVSSKTIKQTIELGASISGLDFNSEGSEMAVYCRDQTIKLIDPRSGRIKAEGHTEESTRGGRIIYLGETGRLLTTGFGPGSQRQVKIYNLELECLATFSYDISPAILIPVFEEGTGVVFMSSKGGTSVYMLETSNEEPWGFQLAPYQSTEIQQALCHLPITSCDISGVEIMRCLKFLKDKIEVLSFTIPRTAKEWFQDDLYPPARETWKSSICSADWFSGKNMKQGRIDLCPPNMKPVSQKPEEIKTKKYAPPPADAYKETDTKDDLLSRLSAVANDNVDSRTYVDHDGGSEEEWSD